jgi:hypothetical protein
LDAERDALVELTIVSKQLLELPGFGPAAEALFFREKDPKPSTPSLATPLGSDPNLWSADQLAEPVLSLAEGLKQGPRNNTSIRPKGQSAGVGHLEK